MKNDVVQMRGEELPDGTAIIWCTHRGVDYWTGEPYEFETPDFIDPWWYNDKGLR